MHVGRFNLSTCAKLPLVAYIDGVASFYTLAYNGAGQTSCCARLQPSDRPRQATHHQHHRHQYRRPVCQQLSIVPCPAEYSTRVDIFVYDQCLPGKYPEGSVLVHV